MKISNSLIGTVDLILSKELSFDDIDKIYSLESYTKEDIPFIIDTYGNLWSAITKRIIGKFVINMVWRNYQI